VIDAGANDYTTKLENTQGTELRELLYQWHPWAGLSVGVHESVEKPEIIIFLAARALLSDDLPKHNPR
jgi:hypothetical protein